MNTATPLVSVVLPTYDRVRLLGEAVASVLAQSHRDLELIVVDDGSTDDTLQYLASLDDPRLRVLPRPHTGNTATLRNAGIASARGEWIAFLDSDDLWRPSKLAAQLDGLLAREERRWSYTAFALIDEAGRPLAQGPAETVPAPSSGWIREELLAYVTAVPLPSLLVRRRLLDEVGRLDAGLVHDDFDLVLRLAAAAPAHCVSEPLLVIRKDSARPWSVDDSLRHHEQMDRVLAKHLASADSGLVRVLCRAQRAHHLWRIARARAGLGRYRGALSAAFGALLRSPDLVRLRRFRRSVRRRALGRRDAAVPGSDRCASSS